MASHFILLLEVSPFLPWFATTCAPYYANYTPPFHVLSLWHTLIHTYKRRGEDLAGEGSRAGSKACVCMSVCVWESEPGYLVENSCPLLSLPLTPAWQQLEIWGLCRPLSWERRTGRHTYSQKSFCLCSLSRSPLLTHTYKEERKPFVYAHSLIQPQIKICVSHIHSLCQPHKTIKLSHAWFLFIVCLLNSFISCFSQFGAICLSILLSICFSLHFSPASTLCFLFSVS